MCYACHYCIMLIYASLEVRKIIRGQFVFCIRVIEKGNRLGLELDYEL